MQTFDQSLAALLEAGEVSFEEAMVHASRPSDFALHQRGVLADKAAEKVSPFLRARRRRL
jgi:Tfp pilus assembly ATPase PilU